MVEARTLAKKTFFSEGGGGNFLVFTVAQNLVLMTF